MQLGIKTSNLSPIAVDFGCDQVKLLQVELDAQMPRLIAAAGRVVPHAIRNDPEQRRTFLTDSIAELLKEAGFKGKRAIASIPSAMTFVQHVRLSGDDSRPVDQRIVEELRGQLPVDPACLVIRHVDIGQVTTHGATRREMICIAAGRQAVLHHIDILKRARLHTVGMHGEPVAILKAFGHLFRRADDDKLTTLFVDLGYRTSKVLIAHGANLVFAKQIQVGGEHFDRQFAEELGIELEEARLRRRRQADQEPAQAPVQLPQRKASPISHDAGPMAMIEEAMQASQNGSKPSPIRAGEPGHEMIPAGGEMLDCLIDEIQLCVGYHQSMFSGRRVDRVVFLGGEANQRAMCRRMAAALRLPAQLGDPLCRVGRAQTAKPPVGVDLRQCQPGWAVPLGLCQLPANL